MANSVRIPSGSATLTCAILIATSLGACSLHGDYARSPGVLNSIRSLDLTPRQTGDVGTTSSIPDNRVAVEYQATATAVSGADVGGSGAGQPNAGSSEGYNLNFENAPLTAVAKVVLGDIMGVGYTIDPRVQGTISLASGRAVSKKDILYVLEGALRTGNVALIRDTASNYRLVPIAEAAGSGRTDVGTADVEPGYGLSVVPLRYVSAQALMPLLDSFATRSGAARVDSGRNILLVQGSAAERRAAIDTVLSFDEDWMRGQSVGIYPVRNSAPEPLIAELENVMDSGEGGLSHSLVKFQPISRLNSILVVSRKPDLLRTAATWISRLDRADTTNVRVYRMRYGEAKQMAKILNELFVGGSSTGLDQATSQVAPGSGISVSSSSDGESDSSSSSEGPSVERRLGMSPNASTSGEASGAEADLAGADGPSPGGQAGAALPGVRITADAVNNTLLIYASQEQYRIIERTLTQLDQPQLQVAIEATVAEVTLNDTLDYGVQFYLTSKDLGLGRNNGSMGNTISGSAGKSYIGQVLPGFNLLAGAASQPTVILDALDAVTDVKVLSNPSVVVMDNQAATLQVGDDVPISTGSATVLTSNNTVVNTIEYKNTGIILHVIPRVNVNGQVRLAIEQEISNVARGSTSSTLTPTVSQRKVKSTIAVADGQTVLLAGLISERQDRLRSGIPILGRLPGIGNAFSHNSKSAGRTELIIFIRPQIIRDSVDAHTVAEELRAKLSGSPGTALRIH